MPSQISLSFLTPPPSPSLPSPLSHTHVPLTHSLTCEGETFVTRKVTRSVAQIHLGHIQSVSLKTKLIQNKMLFLLMFFFVLLKDILLILCLFCSLECY